MRKIFLQFILFVFFVTNSLNYNVLAQDLVQIKSHPDHSGLEFSIVTCDYGHDLASAFGHVAIRMKQENPKRDLIFDYGTFTFNVKFFVFKFMRGDLLYYLSIRDFERFRHDYIYENRTVTEQKLNLTEEQKKILYNFLRTNYLPENKFYRYDFITDNCATRIRDIFNQRGYAHINLPTDSTFRQYIEPYIDNKKWLQLGIDLLLGQVVDEKADQDAATFTPKTISANLMRYNNLANNLPLLSPPTTIIRGETHRTKFHVFQPVIVFSLTALLAVLALAFKKCRLLHGFGFAFHIVISLVGIVLIFMWLCSRYPCTKMNWNLMWTLPLYPLLWMPLKWPVKRAIVILQNALLATVILLGWWALPQHFNSAVYPLALTLIMINANEMMLGRAKAALLSKNNTLNLRDFSKKKKFTR